MELPCHNFDTPSLLRLNNESNLYSSSPYKPEHATDAGVHYCILHPSNSVQIDIAVGSCTTESLDVRKIFIAEFSGDCQSGLILYACTVFSLY